MKAFEFNKAESVMFPALCQRILDYTQSKGVLNFTPTLANIESYWEDFSESCYCAGFMEPDEVVMADFAEWLSRLDI